MAPPSFFLSRWLFLRLLGVVYLAAFLSLWVQVHGLIGQHGILPVSEYLKAVYKSVGSDGYYLAPTLCWLNSSDAFLNGLCAGGVALACLLILDAAPVPVLFLLWAYYLSLTTAGQIFLGYQWDALLLETGFLSIFFAPLHIRPRLSHTAAPSRVVVWLLGWLLFRLIFGSGVVKLASGDLAWRNLAALQFHYETQPLPTWTSWYMHQLAAGFQQRSVVYMFAGELLVPLFIFAPRRGRLVAFTGIVALQLLIAATGNYGFFNLLTIVLCVPLLEDSFFPARWRGRFAPSQEASSRTPGRKWSFWITGPLAASILILSVLNSIADLNPAVRWPAGLVRVRQITAAFGLVNRYGLFAVMTQQRREILVEGSDDGHTWKPYVFKWKPGDVQRRPEFAGLHLPRLDWQMWFAALGRCEDNPWFVRFLDCLLRGSPEVVALLEDNPFPDRPPRYVRSTLYLYHFTGMATRQETGAWWQRQPIGPYCPVFSRR